ncbi:hypothetical protein L228DRAFT_94720 [Xylona heveae TC161]|uniref:RanBD1 domain-containing protein n=1 Tax=Xylona heveae (strain CBS 132557 / TC161) TaxID=1328760 RepID=A0A161TPY5_XYLHT|nr:hypothetical protein L228DRAFT_94720 [Xylona heveae TC161]KZF24336.1 hypothetical protein L228DRAFT_94720 [Xylona heveae TC161]
MSKRVQNSQGSREGFFNGDGSDGSSTMDSPRKATAAQLARRQIKPAKSSRRTGNASFSSQNAPGSPVGQSNGNVFGSSLSFPPSSSGDSGQSNSQPSSFSGFGSTGGGGFNFAAPSAGFSFSAGPSSNPFANLNGASNQTAHTKPDNQSSGFNFFSQSPSAPQSSNEAPKTNLFGNIKPADQASGQNIFSQSLSAPQSSPKAQENNLFGNIKPADQASGSSLFDKSLSAPQSSPKVQETTLFGNIKPADQASGQNLFSQSLSAPQSSPKAQETNLFGNIKPADQASGSSLFDKSFSAPQSSNEAKNTSVFANIKPADQASGPNNIFSNPFSSPQSSNKAQEKDLPADSKPANQVSGLTHSSQSLSAPKSSNEAKNTSVFANIKPADQASGSNNIFSKSFSSPQSSNKAQENDLSADSKPANQASGSDNSSISSSAPQSSTIEAQKNNLSADHKPANQAPGSTNIFSKSLNAPQSRNEAQSASIFANLKPANQAPGSTNLFSNPFSAPPSSNTEAQTKNLFVQAKPDTQSSGSSNIFSKSFSAPSSSDNEAQTKSLFAQAKPDTQSSGSSNIFSKSFSAPQSSNEAQKSNLFAQAKPDTQSSGSSNIFSKSFSAPQSSNEAQKSNLFAQAKPDTQSSGSSNIFSKSFSAPQSSNEAQKSNLFAQAKPDTQSSGSSNIFSKSFSAPQSSNEAQKSNLFAQHKPDNQASGTNRFSQLVNASQNGKAEQATSKPDTQASNVPQKKDVPTNANHTNFSQLQQNGGMIPAQIGALNTTFKDAVAAASIHSDLSLLVQSYLERRQAILDQDATGEFGTTHVTSAPPVGGPLGSSNKRKADDNIYEDKPNDAEATHKKAKPNEPLNGVHATQTTVFNSHAGTSNKGKANEEISKAPESHVNGSMEMKPDRPMTSPGNQQAGGNVSTQASLKSAAPTSAGPPKFSMPKFAGGNANFAAFGKSAEASMEKEKAKRKAEDFDSDEESEEQWERRDLEAQRAKKARLAEQSQGRTAKFVPGKGFVWEGERKDTSPDEQRDAKMTNQDAEAQRLTAAEPAARPAPNVFSNPITAAAATAEIPASNTVRPARGGEGSKDSSSVTGPFQSEPESELGAGVSTASSDDDSGTAAPLSLAGGATSLLAPRGAAGSKDSSDGAGPSGTRSELGTGISTVLGDDGSDTASLRSPGGGAVSILDSPRSEVGSDIRETNLFASPSAALPKLEGRQVEELPDDADTVEDAGKATEKPGLTAFTPGSALPPAASQSPGGSSIFGSPFSTAQPGTLFGSPKSDQTWKPDSPIKFSPGTTSVAAPTSSLFGSGSNVGFAFGGPPKAPDSLSPSTEISRATTPGATTDTGAESAADSAADAGEASASEAPQANFSARGPGEENEDVLFQVRAKAMMMVTNDGKKEWENKGVGPCRILKHEHTGKSRIVMRQDPSGTLVINAAVLKGIKYEYKAPKSVTFQTAAADGKLSFWLVRVGKDSDAMDLAKTLESAK